jgi:DNA-directed RNA polymerase specialized sigma24 family protein
MAGDIQDPSSAFCLLLSADNLTGTDVVSCSVRRRRAGRTLASGDEAEFSAFVARDGGQLLGFAFLLVGNRHDAEDLVQQALLRTAGRWSAARQSPAGYSRTVLLNLVRDRWRIRQRRDAETLSPDLTALPSASDAAAAVLDRQLLLRACRGRRAGTHSGGRRAVIQVFSGSNRPPEQPPPYSLCREW